MNTAERRATAALWSIRGVGPVTLREVRKRLGPLGDLLEQPLERWAPLIPWRGDALEHLSTVSTLSEQADRLEQCCAANGMEVVFPRDPVWPEKLDSISDPPPLLFVKGPGARAPQRRRLAIVGTRNPEGGAGERCAALAEEAARAGIGIVSGAATGIDQAAHRGALNAGGETWAFMGSGLDQIDSPQQPIAAAMLAAGGTLFSQFPPGFRSNRSSFTLRNKLISGASDAVLVLRAGAKSGALYTATAAVEQGRPLLATPGDPWNPRAAGSNELLRSGKARPHLGLGDLFDAVGLTGSISPATSLFVERELLSEKAREVFDALGAGGLDFEGMMEALPAFSSGQLSSALVELEVLGAVLHKGGKRYEKR